jgi:hypothetical protein
LPSHRGCRDGSAMSSKILSAGAAISRPALTTLGTSATIQFNIILTVTSCWCIVDPELDTAKIK